MISDCTKIVLVINTPFTPCFYHSLPTIDRSHRSLQVHHGGSLASRFFKGMMCRQWVHC